MTDYARKVEIHFASNPERNANILQKIEAFRRGDGRRAPKIYRAVFQRLFLGEDEESLRKLRDMCVETAHPSEEEIAAYLEGDLDLRGCGWCRGIGSAGSG